MRRLLGANCAGSISMKTSLRAAVVLVAICHSAYRVHAQERLTFTRDVAPVLFERCASCHRPGQIAPFSLLTYEDVRPRATRIADVVRSRAMPPWKPEPDHGRFQRDRRMTEVEILAIESWVAQGMMRGSPGGSPASAQVFRCMAARHAGSRRSDGGRLRAAGTTPRRLSHVRYSHSSKSVRVRQSG